MTIWKRASIAATIVALALGTALLLPAQGTPGPGRGKGKKAKGPSDPAPRNAQGRVTLGPGPGKTGFWGGGGSLIGKNGNNLPTNPTLDEVPFMPWSKALYAIRQSVGQKDDPHARCLPPGGPRQYQTPNGFEFIEEPDRKRITLIYGGGPRTWRFIYLDGRALPPADDDRLPTYFGYSSGHWEGDTLVVESEGYNEKFWMMRGGLPHTEALHLTERFSRPDYDTLKYEVRINDPRTYTRPWDAGFTVPWTYTNWDGTPGGEIHEYLCQDNERDWERLR